MESAQPDYRRIWQQEPLNEEKRIEILSQLAADVFKTRTVKRLRARSGEFDAFRSAISLEGGEAELGFWYAHRLYNIVERGRMLGIWHGQIQSHLWDRIREAENLWYNPDLVPKGWEEFCTPSEATSDAPANRTVLEEDYKPGPPSGNRQAGLHVTSSIADLRWEDLQIQFVSDERVQVTARGRTETRNYAEMGFEDKRNGKPTEAWSVLRTLAENRGSTQVGVGPARSKLVKQIQQLRKKLGELYPAVGDPLPYVYGTYVRARGKPDAAQLRDSRGNKSSSRANSAVVITSAIDFARKVETC